jgi:hypothetical protein
MIGWLIGLRRFDSHKVLREELEEGRVEVMM